MTNPAPVEPFNGKPADSLQGTDISPAQAYKMTNLDDILRRIAYWNGYDTAGEWERTGHEVKAQVEDYIATQTKEAYRKGYNDNARDCYCDSTKVIESLIPHKHLMDDGKSHAYNQLK